MTQKTYVPAEHFEYIQRPMGIPITMGYPNIEPDYSGGSHYSGSIISAIFELADFRTGVIAPNVSTRLFVYKDLFNLYKPFDRMCNFKNHSGHSNSHIVKALKQHGYMPFKAEDENIPDVWIKAGEIARFRKHPETVLPILQRIGENPTDSIEDKINAYIRNAEYAPPPTTEEFIETISILIQHNQLLKAANRLAHRQTETERLTIIKEMAKHLQSTE